MLQLFKVRYYDHVLRTMLNLFDFSSFNHLVSEICPILTKTIKTFYGSQMNNYKRYIY